MPVPPLAVTVTPELADAWPADGFGRVSLLMASLPDPSAMVAGAWVGMLPGPAKKKGLAGMFGGKPKIAHVAVRCAALLAKGYVDVGAAVDEAGQEIAFGRAP
jgi:hypothetical protein